MIIFLDLEETLLDNWNDGNFLPKKLTAVKQLLEENSTAEIGLMSWAVWDERDKERFKHHFQEDLERVLGIKFCSKFLWSMDDWANQMFVHAGFKLERSELFNIFPKQEVLFRLARVTNLFRGHVVLLVDDAVEHNMTIDVPSNNCTVKFINVDELVISN